GAQPQHQLGACKRAAAWAHGRLPVSNRLAELERIHRRPQAGVQGVQFELARGVTTPMPPPLPRPPTTSHTVVTEPAAPGSRALSLRRPGRPNAFFARLALRHVRTSMRRQCGRSLPVQGTRARRYTGPNISFSDIR